MNENSMNSEGLELLDALEIGFELTDYQAEAEQAAESTCAN